MAPDTILRPQPSLTGTLDDFDVAELLRFLAATGASGRLDVHGEIDVSLWWADGRVLAGDSEAEIPIEDALAARGVQGTDDPDVVRAAAGGVLAERRVEAVFQLLVVGDAAFAFHRGEGMPEGWPDVVPSVDPAELLADAGRRIERWREIAATIPSANVVVRMAAELPSGTSSIALDADEFRLLAMLDGRRTIAELTAVVGASAFEVCERVHRLVQRGAATVDR